MREEQDRPEPEADPTEPFAAALPAPEAAPAPDEGLLGELLDHEPPAPLPSTPARRFRAGLGKVMMATGGVIALLALVYVADLMLSAGDVPRGVTVAGVEVGGMSHGAAEAKLRIELEPRLVQPIPVRAGDARAELDPTTSGLGLDWQATLDQAGHQPLNPVRRVLSFFRAREVGVVPTIEPRLIRQAVTELASERLNHGLTEGTIRFEPAPGDGAVRPVAVEPRQAQELTDIEGAVRIVTDDWLTDRTIEFPMRVTPPKASSAGVHAALDQVVAPAVAAPIRVRGEGTAAVLRPEDVAGSLQFAAVPDGSLQIRVDQSTLRRVLLPQLVGTEQRSRNARIVFAAGKPDIQPSAPGRQINWARTLAPLMDVARRAADRELPVAYDTRPARVTTSDAERFGIKEVIGEFTTGGFPGDVAHNIGVIARQVDGTIVRPGQTFSLDEHTGPRTASRGYRTAPVHEDGTGPPVIGGGVSQLTSTLYNAIYLAGLKDAGHTEHATHFSRYPVARDASSLRENGSSVEMAFTNDSSTGVAIQASASGGTVTVRIWGTKRYRVESVPAPRTDVVPPPISIGPPEDCTPVAGTPGFSTSNTRILYDLESGAEVSRQTRDVRYAARPTVIC
ncbi:VanW family protein [Amycolatopsis cihanbeyliensis]|uniref:Vancomycin resistance protein YoaR n=1 Tax=Amycolatopsis cihanbeyliensis TaxID=1128664 RepID=A0A542DKU0_AMYCI|nr:VanW family protein [Amycolatopsis cihanbeyliensis]TQJ03709.1 vancomycin resistance protein YoaR [Amycolatopsis cihanbeyliensis]